MREPSILVTSLVALAIANLSCGLIPEKVALDDPRIQPMLQAMSRVERTELGFTPIADTADIRLEGQGSNYDAMLHIYAETQRTVAFRKVDDGYYWIGEQETHSGPGTFESVDGVVAEQITLTYETEDISGHCCGRVDIRYRGKDSRLAGRRDLTLEDVGPVLAEWKAKSDS